MKIVIWKDGSHKIVNDGITHEFENDKDWLTTVSMEEVIREVAGNAFTAGQLFGTGNNLIDKETYLTNLNNYDTGYNN